MNKVWLFCLCTIFLFLTWTVPVQARVLSNENMTVSIGNEKSWTGRNGTGNLSYYGCDSNCDCIYLTGGTISCRDGVCQTVWKDNNSTYALSSPITQVNTYSQIPSTLTISSDRANMSVELYPKPFDNLKSSSDSNDR